MKIMALILFVLAMSAFESSAGVNIVSNGDFEIIVDGYYPPPWQFSHGFNGFVNEPSKVASGGNCVFIGGISGGDMWQDLNTVVGQTYELSFFERGDDPGQTERLSLLNVWWGSQEVGSYANDNKVSGWNHYDLNVIASSTTTRIDFQQASFSIGSYGYPGIDAVSVMAIPELPTSRLFAVTLVMCLAVRFCDRRSRCSEI